MIDYSKRKSPLAAPTEPRSDTKVGNKTVKLTDPQADKEITLPVLESSVGPDIIDIRPIYSELGYFTFDPGFVSTASCESKITYIDGGRGLLSYRGYTIEQLAENSNYPEVCYLLLYGELPKRRQLDEFNHSILTHGGLDRRALTSLFDGFGKESHPMAMLMAAVSYLAALYHRELAIHDPRYRERAAHRLIAKTATIAAWIVRYRNGQALAERDPELSYTEGFLKMAFGDFDGRPALREKFAAAMDLILLLHADHEQNASTSTVRLSGSTETNPYAALTAGITSLWGAAHGGANEAVIHMLETIVDSGRPLDYYIQRAKDKNDHFRLMGFGHRVYKNYDPRARILRGTCLELLAQLEDDGHRPLLETARRLEKIALEDDYFISRKLYPNVDFYSGIILNAMGLPRDMFTVIFALARTIGWISHWNEMMADAHTRLGRPRQLYTGSRERSFTPIAER